MKCVFISDFDIKGSGYSNIASSLCEGLAALGHDVKAIGLSYTGSEHNFHFSILPAGNLQEIIATFNNLAYMWQPEVVIVALDIPLQEALMNRILPYKVPYIMITPLESDPLCLPWAMVMMGADKVFVISEFGAEEAKNQGVPAEHIQIGIDTVSWRIPSPEEKHILRQALLGIDDDETFVVLTVADNQERKNLSASMEIIGNFKKEVSDNFKYVLVTREHSQIGYKLRDLATRHDINSELMIFERGLSFKELWSVYACADVFLLNSKAEGLGMPVLEAMAVGVPCVLSEAGALVEHARKGGAWLVESEYEFIDSWGNSRRVLVNKEDALDALVAVHNKLDLENAVKTAREYVESRTWDIPVRQLDSAIKELTHEKEQTIAAV